MKKIAIISAMDLELNPLLKLIENAKKIEDHIWKTNLDDKEIFFVISGIGKVNISSTSTYMIIKHNIDYIINIGVAGSLCKSVKPFDIVVANETTYHDFDLREFNHKMGQVPGYKPTFKTNHIFNFGIIGLIVSGDLFVTPYKVNEIKQNFSEAIAVDMESAACAQVCEKFNIPWSIIRTISDDGNNQDNVKEYQENKNKATEILAQKIIDNIKML